MHVVAKTVVSERRACRVLGQHRSTQRKIPEGQADEDVLTPLDDAFLAAIRARPWIGRELPMHQSDICSLFGALIRQHLSVSLFRAGALSLATEHTARLALMTRAEKALEERLGNALSAFGGARQPAITDELPDIVGGFAALTQNSPTRTHPTDGNHIEQHD